MGAYTSGPWAWRGAPGNSELHGAKGCVLGYDTYEGMWLSYDADAEGRAANARLIAASPDLLEALIAILPDAEANHVGGPDTGARIDVARSAIAKATRESP